MYRLRFWFKPIWRAQIGLIPPLLMDSTPCHTDYFLLSSRLFSEVTIIFPKNTPTNISRVYKSNILASIDINILSLNRNNKASITASKMDNIILNIKLKSIFITDFFLVDYCWKKYKLALSLSTCRLQTSSPAIFPNYHHTFKLFTHP